MSNQDQAQNLFSGTKKRMVPTNDLMGKFSCKADFIKYFKEHCESLIYFAFYTYSTTLFASRDRHEQRFLKISSLWLEVAYEAARCPICERASFRWIERCKALAFNERGSWVHVLFPLKTSKRQSSW